MEGGCDELKALFGTVGGGSFPGGWDRETEVLKVLEGQWGEEDINEVEVDNFRFMVETEGGVDVGGPIWPWSWQMAEREMQY